jgi:hypothetical protein
VNTGLDTTASSSVEQAVTINEGAKQEVLNSSNSVVNNATKPSEKDEEVPESEVEEERTGENLDIEAVNLMA